MATLNDASLQDLTRLLELFPISTLKQQWGHLKGQKDELCSLIAAENDKTKIAAFVMKNFARCRQHTYIFGPRTEDHGAPQDALPGVAELGKLSDADQFFIGIAKFTVLIRDPQFRQEDVTFLWPMRVQYRPDATVTSFIVLERDVKALFQGEVLNVRRHIEEKTVVEGIAALQYSSLDLNKGVKALWAADFMDAFRSKFKKARSTTTEAMDREQGIKATDPELYKLMQTMPMFETMFRVAPKSKSAVEAFQVNPTDGSLKMTRYTEGEGDSNGLVGKILEANS